MRNVEKSVNDLVVPVSHWGKYNQPNQNNDTLNHTHEITLNDQRKTNGQVFFYIDINSQLVCDEKKSEIYDNDLNGILEISGRCSIPTIHIYSGDDHILRIINDNGKIKIIDSLNQSEIFSYP